MTLTVLLQKLALKKISMQCNCLAKGNTTGFAGSKPHSVVLRLTSTATAGYSAHWVETISCWQTAQAKGEERKRM